MQLKLQSGIEFEFLFDPSQDIDKTLTQTNWIQETLFSKI